MVRLLLLRHGQSTWNADGRWQGWADPPLSAVGVAQASAAGRWLAASGLTFGRVACSDLRRADATARIMSASLGLGEVVVDQGLRERDIGEWSGLTRKEIEARWPGMIEDWRAGRIDRTPGGEPWADFTARLIGALDRVVAGAPRGGPNLLVVTHGGSIRALERHLGAETTGIANLGGRWVELVDGRLLAGPVSELPDPDDLAVAATP